MIDCCFRFQTRSENKHMLSCSHLLHGHSHRIFIKNFLEANTYKPKSSYSAISLSTRGSWVIKLFIYDFISHFFFENEHEAHMRLV
jgi:hypothetical protein